MQRIINFFIDNRVSVLYAILMFFSVALTMRSHSYHQSKLFNSSKWLTGSIYKVSKDISNYFALRQINETLAKENLRLRKLLFNQKTENQAAIDSNGFMYHVIPATIINNNFSSPRNYLTLDKGKKHGLEKDMGVITPMGILGIVENTSNNFATVQSILNTKSSINAKIKNTDYFGSLTWNTQDHRTVQLTDIPRSAPILVGDTIITGGMSSIFPEGIPIGVVKKYGLNASQSFFDIEVGLFNNMANQKLVYVLNNALAEEQSTLEKETLDGQ